MRVSVIVPCHNYGHFVEEAIESALGQTTPPHEILVCDDGSRDDSWVVLQRLSEAHPTVSAYRHDVAHGLIRTFNELVERCTGDVVVPLSADDLLSPEFLERSVAAIEGGADFAYPGMRAFGAESWDQAPLTMSLDRLARWNYICATSAMRREVLLSVGGYRQSFDALGFEDYDFWLSVVEHGFTGVPVPEAWLHWRRHEAGSRNTASRMDRLRLRWKLIRHHPRFFLHPRSVRALRQPSGAQVPAAT